MEGWIGVVGSAVALAGLAFREWRQSIKDVAEIKSKTDIALETAKAVGEINVLKEQVKHNTQALDDCEQGHAVTQGKLDRVEGHLEVCNDQHKAILVRVESLEQRT